MLQFQLIAPHFHVFAIAKVRKYPGLTVEALAGNSVGKIPGSLYSGAHLTLTQMAMRGRVVPEIGDVKMRELVIQN